MLPDETKGLSALIGLAYASATDPTHWQFFLDELSSQSGAEQVTLAHHDFSKNLHAIVSTNAPKPEMQKKYELHFGKQDVWASASRSKQTGWRGSGFELWSEAVMRTTEFYNDFLRAADLYYLYGAQLLNRDSEVASITLMRSERAGDFDPTVPVLMDLLTPHLQRSVQIQQRIGIAESRAQGFENLLEKSSRAVMLLNADGKVIFENAVARNILKQGDGLTIREGRLVATYAVSDRALCGLVAACVSTSNGVDRGNGGGVSLPRRKSEQPLRALVVPLRTEQVLSPVRPSVAVIVDDPDAPPESRDAAWNNLFGFSPTELKLATQLAQGVELRDAADRLGITYQTARSYLKAIFSKTGTTRQVALIRILNGLSF